MPEGTEVVKSEAELKAEAEAAAKAAAEAAEHQRLKELGFGFPHPDHVEKQADGSDKYKADPPPKDYSVK